MASFTTVTYKRVQSRGRMFHTYDDIRINATLTQLNSICNEIKRILLNKTKHPSERVYRSAIGLDGANADLYSFSLLTVCA